MTRSIEIASVDREALGVLSVEMMRTYADAGAERTAIHKEAWRKDKAAMSPLPEAEIRADFVMGIADTWLRHGYDATFAKQLGEHSVFRCTLLAQWLGDHGSRYPRFALYLAIVEHMRSLLAKIADEASSS